MNTQSKSQTGQASPNASAIRLMTSSDLNEVRKNLRAMIDAYLLQTEDEMEYPKVHVYDTFYLLDKVLNQLQEQKTILKVA